MPPRSHPTTDRTNPLVIAHLDQNPSLKAANGAVSMHALASKNAKTLLKAAFPGVAFEVTTETYAGGSSLSVYWTEYPDAPDVGAVHGVIDRFAYGMGKGHDPIDRDPDRNAFRATFGRVRFSMAMPRALTPAQRVAQETAQLHATMDEMGTSLAPSAPRARL